MTATLDARDTDRFRLVIARRLGLNFDESKWELLTEVLQRRLNRGGLACGTYLDRLESRPSAHDELRELARELTVGETYFFRNFDQFRALTEVALPERIAARASTRTLNLLSAGCASGEEPYSLAMLVRERHLDPSWTISVVGIDVNPAALEKAAAARYSSWSLRETGADARARWFRPDGRDLTLDPTIKSAVKFEERNLVDENPTLWRPDSLDVVFCRNVLMYLTPDHARAVLARITRSLTPNGFLFLGHAETLRGLSNDFHLLHTHGTFYYRRKGSSFETDRSLLVNEIGPLPRFEPPADAPGDADAETWIDVIRQASARIHNLTEDRPPTATAMPARRPTPLPPVVLARPDLSLAFELLRHERFFEALAFVRDLPSDSARDPDALLLEAALLTHSGQLAAAEKACTDLLALDEMSAGAHYLLALCREGEGDRAAAIDHDQVAAYLDPGFAMPRLHMGLLARRAGQREVAQRELGLALPLLQREDAPRLLLFGGGFTRDALAAMCRSELAAAGGRT